MNLEAHLGQSTRINCAQPNCEVGLWSPDELKTWYCLTHRVCPRCLSDEMKFPALSRTDNKTKICSPCGRIEGIEDLVTGQPLPQLFWAVND
jgi:hypothetical protein